MFKGLMPAMVTPFDGDGNLDLRAAEAVMDRSIEAGVDGILVLGSTGEFSHLTHEERRLFAEVAAGLVDGRVPLLVGVGASGTKEAVLLAEHAAGAGADAVVVVSPYYWNVGEEGLFRHFAAVAEAAPVPAMIYNFPMLTGIDLSPALVRRVAEECPNVVGIKDTVTEYAHTVKVLRAVKPVRPDFAVFAGFEDQILPSLLAGADGAISGLTNLVPNLLVEMVRAATTGDLETAAELHRRILPLMDLYALSEPGIGALKAAMNRLGVPISPTVRLPALPAPDGALEKIEGTLRDAGLL